jgi:hypothetical protein
MNPDPEVTRAQQNFLAAFTQNPTGPVPAEWPSPGVLRRWLKDKRFRKSLTALRDAIRFQTDFHLAAAASTAARAVQTTLNPAVVDPTTDPAALADLAKTLKSLTDLLRLAHLRERFTPAAAAPPAQGARSRRESAAEYNRKLAARVHTPNGWEAIINDPERLKGVMLLAAMRGVTAYDPFLSAFPEELAEARASYARLQRDGPQKGAGAAQPTPVPNTR